MRLAWRGTRIGANHAAKKISIVSVIVLILVYMDVDQNSIDIGTGLEVSDQQFVTTNLS